MLDHKEKSTLIQNPYLSSMETLLNIPSRTVIYISKISN